MELTFLGSGDAFGSGGRWNTCFLLRGRGCTALIDCGASSLIALKRANVDPNAVDVILITHFHADHFGGIPFLMLDAQFFARRRRPLQIAGPVGLATWYARVMETAFPGSSRTPPKFPLELLELAPGCSLQLGPLRVTGYQAHHDPSGGGPFLALRVELEGRVISYTGDGEWSDALLEAARGADVFIAEAYFRDQLVPLHLSLCTLLEKLPLLSARRVIATHMSREVLEDSSALPVERAYDGLCVPL